MRVRAGAERRRDRRLSGALGSERASSLCVPCMPQPNCRSAPALPPRSWQSRSSAPAQSLALRSGGTAFRFSVGCTVPGGSPRRHVHRSLDSAARVGTAPAATLRGSHDHRSCEPGVARAGGHSLMQWRGLVCLVAACWIASGVVPRAHADGELAQYVARPDPSLHGAKWARASRRRGLRRA